MSLGQNFGTSLSDEDMGTVRSTSPVNCNFSIRRSPTESEEGQASMEKLGHKGSFCRKHVSHANLGERNYPILQNEGYPHHFWVACGEVYYHCCFVTFVEVALISIVPQRSCVPAFLRSIHHGWLRSLFHTRFGCSVMEFVWSRNVSHPSAIVSDHSPREIWMAHPLVGMQDVIGLELKAYKLMITLWSWLLYASLPNGLICTFWRGPGTIYHADCMPQHYIRKWRQQPLRTRGLPYILAWEHSAKNQGVQDCYRVRAGW